MQFILNGKTIEDSKKREAFAFDAAGLALLGGILATIISQKDLFLPFEATTSIMLLESARQKLNGLKR